jgi:hypothetical protein
MSLRTCRDCQETKPAEAFKRVGTGRWHDNLCKACDAKRLRAWEDRIGREEVLRRQRDRQRRYMYRKTAASL